MSQRHLDPEEALLALSLYYSGFPRVALTVPRLQSQNDFIDDFIERVTGLTFYTDHEQILKIRYAYFELRGWHKNVPPRYQGGLQQFQ